MNTLTVAELGNSDHNMVLLKPSGKMTLDTGNMTRMSVNVWLQRKRQHEHGHEFTVHDHVHGLRQCGCKVNLDAEITFSNQVEAPTVASVWC